jgi:hypothetical protein
MPRSGIGGYTYSVTMRRPMRRSAQDLHLQLLMSASCFLDGGVCARMDNFVGCRVFDGRVGANPPQRIQHRQPLGSLVWSAVCVGFRLESFLALGVFVLWHHQEAGLALAFFPSVRHFVWITELKPLAHVRLQFAIQRSSRASQLESVSIGFVGIWPPRFGYGFDRLRLNLAL